MRPALFWQGKSIEDLSREELLDVVVQLADELKDYRTPEIAEAIGIGKAEQVKRTLPCYRRH